MNPDAGKGRLVARFRWRPALAIPLVACALAALLYLVFAPFEGIARAQQPDAPAGAADSLLVRVAISPTEDLTPLARDYDVWEVHRAEGYILVATDLDGIQALRVSGRTATVDWASTVRMRESSSRITQGRTAAQELDAGGSSASRGIPGYTCYRTVDETWADLAALSTTWPTLARWVDIGDSWEKSSSGGTAGNDLFALEITNRAITGTVKFPFVVMAAIHARELTTAEAATRFAERLVKSYGVDPDVTWLLDYGAIYVIPYANPDGRRYAEAGALWRKNTHDDGLCGPAGNLSSDYGIDLNRNASQFWNACEVEGTGTTCSSDYSCSETFRGLSPASEPETQAIEGYIRSVMPDQRGDGLADRAPITTTGLFISLHSYGQLVLWPWGWTGDAAPNGDELETLGRKFTSILSYAGCAAGSSCLYRTDGTTDDWAYGQLGVASYTFELGNWFFEDCGDFESTIITDTLDALEYAALASRQPYVTPAGPDVLSVALDRSMLQNGVPFTLASTLGAVGATGAIAPDDPGAAGLAAGDIATATWWLDTPPWLADSLTHTVVSGALLPADGEFDSPEETVSAVITPTGWTLGRHILFVQGMTENGTPGMTRAVFADVFETNLIRLPWIERNEPRQTHVE